MGNEIEMRAESALPVPLTEERQSSRALTVFARNPQEMSVAQAQLVRWAADKIAEVTRDRDELQENFEIATRNGWGFAAIGRQLGKAKKRLSFYEKVKAALDAGYCIVPGFPIGIFAVRTEKTEPAGKMQSTTNMWASPALPAVESESPALGAGEYVSNTSAGKERRIMEGDKHVGFASWPTEFRDVDFPFAFAQPAVLHATQQAMAAKIFDELGVSPDPRQRAAGDPMVIGRIYAPRQHRWQRESRSVSFVVAWFLRPERDLDF